MRSFAAAALLGCAVLLIPCGCIQWLGGDPTAAGPATVTRESLQVSISADRYTVKVGEQVHVTVTARNLSRTPIQIESATAAPVIVTLWRYDRAKGWVRVRQFPTAPLRRHSRWELGKKEQRTFRIDLPVEPDWPSLTTLKLSAELNGRPDARPHVFVYVQPK
jgi:hypothetical protein